MNDRALWQAAGCTSRQIEILELRFYRGLSYDQISAATELSISSVRSHLKAALRRIELYQRGREDAA